MSGKNQQNTLTVSTEELSPVILQCLDEGQKVRLTVTGNSMCPFLRHERDHVILEKPADSTMLQAGDVVLYRRANGQLVLHRIIERDDGQERRIFGERELFPSMHSSSPLTYTMCGDAQTEHEPDIRPEQIVAVATAFIRKGKQWECGGTAYRRRALRWERWRPVRTLLVWLYLLPSRVCRKIAQICKNKPSRE